MATVQPTGVFCSSRHSSGALDTQRIGVNVWWWGARGGTNDRSAACVNLGKYGGRNGRPERLRRRLVATVRFSIDDLFEINT